MPNLDPQELANTVLDQAMTIRQMGDAIRDRDNQIALLGNSWNTLAMVKERYDELKAEAEKAEAKQVAAEMTAEKRVAETSGPIEATPIGVRSSDPGPSAGKRGGRRR